MTAVIEVEDLAKRYGHVHAVRDVTLTVAQGEVYGVLGPNGSGKTTTVECIAGLRHPDGGSVRVLGHDPAREPATVRERVGVQLQHAALPARMKVAEAMRVFATAYGRRTQGDALLEEWGLDTKRNAGFGSLSGGQQQRLFIALALLGEPQIVVLDELTTGLDPSARRDTWKMVRKLRADGVTVVLVTHAMDEVEALCDRLSIMVGGRVAVSGTPAEIVGGHRTLDEAYLDITDNYLAEV